MKILEIIVKGNIKEIDALYQKIDELTSYEYAREVEKKLGEIPKEHGDSWVGNIVLFLNRDVNCIPCSGHVLELDFDPYNGELRVQVETENQCNCEPVFTLINASLTKCYSMSVMEIW